jgi:hypothetical protein
MKRNRNRTFLRGEEALRGIDPVSGSIILPELTQLVYSGAGEQEDWNFGFMDDIFPVVSTGKPLVLVPTRFGEYLVRVDTHRGPHADIHEFFSKYSSSPLRLERYTAAGLADDDELQYADPWNVAQDAAMLARDLVMIDRAVTARDLITNTANYGYHLAIGAGQGFNLSSGFSLLEVITVAAQAIRSATGVPRSALRLALLGQNAIDGVLLDYQFLQRRIYAQGVNSPTYEDIKNYLRVAEVVGHAPIYRNSVNDATPTEMFPAGAAVLMYPGNQAVLPRGGMLWARRFTVGGIGGALKPYRIDRRTSTAYAWQLHDGFHFFNTGAAALITSPFQPS